MDKASLLSHMKTLLTEWNTAGGKGILLFGQRFVLAEGVVQAADIAWVQAGVRKIPTMGDLPGHFPFCPDFVVRIRSAAEGLDRLWIQMEEWVDNGCRMGWLVDPESGYVYVFEGQAAQSLFQIGEKIPTGGLLPGLDEVALFTIN